MVIEGLISDLKLSSYVRTCPPGTQLADARAVMQAGQIGCILITEGTKVKGIFTERDYLLKVAGREKELENDSIDKFMTKNPVCVQKSDRISVALSHMRLGNFRHLVIIDKEKNVVGVLSIKDLMDYIVDSMTVA